MRKIKELLFLSITPVKLRTVNLNLKFLSWLSIALFMSNWILLVLAYSFDFVGEPFFNFSGNLPCFYKILNKYVIQECDKVKLTYKKKQNVQKYLSNIMSQNLKKEKNWKESKKNEKERNKRNRKKKESKRKPTSQICCLGNFAYFTARIYFPTSNPSLTVFDPILYTY